MDKRIEEKRRYLRVNIPIELEYFPEGSGKVCKAVTKDISASGIRFTANEGLKEGSSISVTLKLPKAQNPVHMLGHVVWVRQGQEENSGLTDVGVEFLKVEEDNKNTFLKYLCDLIYG